MFSRIPPPTGFGSKALSPPAVVSQMRSVHRAKLDPHRRRNLWLGDAAFAQQDHLNALTRATCGRRFRARLRRLTCRLLLLTHHAAPSEPLPSWLGPRVFWSGTPPCVIHLTPGAKYRLINSLVRSCCLRDMAKPHNPTRILLLDRT